ncbi:hypothetical protein [Demequina litorisediminis]|nr:hypothetical protein [Demequina litorisediminis]
MTLLPGETHEATVRAAAVADIAPERWASHVVAGTSVDVAVAEFAR